MSQIIGKVGMTPRGMYERTRAYERLDVVTYQGSSWVAIVDVPAQISPALGSDYWQLQARMGETGPQGPVGPQGNSAFMNDGTVNKYELVNNLTQGGENAVLSAEQGKILKQELTELEGKVNNVYLSAIGSSSSNWEGKKWVCVGDSLTEKNSRATMNYHDYVAEATGIEVVNMGVSGTGYKRQEESGNAFYQRVENIPTDADVITIFGSGNDGAYWGSKLGTASDTTTDTIGGCMNITIDNILARMPLAVIGIVSPCPWGDYPPSTDNAMKRYSALLKQICERRGIPFLDLYLNSGLRPWDATFRELAYSRDDGGSVHPDENGHKLIAPRFKAFLDSLIL